MACDLDDARAFLERLAHHVAPCVGTIDFLRIVGTVAGNNWALGRVTAVAGDDPARVAEHMIGAAWTPAFRSKILGGRAVGRGFGDRKAAGWDKGGAERG